MSTPPIILVPGWWLGAWAWDEVAETLRTDGHAVTALTLPGLESPDADRSAITMTDHVEAIVDAVRTAPASVVLAVHSGSGFPGYAASDRIPDRIAEMVYAVSLTNDARLDIPTTVICTAFPSQEYQAYAKNPEVSFLAGLSELRDVSWVDLPTSHWPMWSKPRELSEIIGRIATTHARPD